MPHFCLPAGPNSGCADPKVEQNLQNSEKYSTRLPSPKPCGLRLRANSKKQRFARNRGQVQRLSSTAFGKIIVIYGHIDENGPFVRKNSGV